MKLTMEKVTLYRYTDKEKDKTYVLEAKEGTEPVTAWLPPKHHLEILEDGSKGIVGPDGSVYKEMRSQTVWGEPSIECKDGKGRTTKKYCKILDGRQQQKIRVYRTNEGEEKRLATWTIQPMEGVETSSVYLPGSCKLIDDKKKKKRLILIPSGGPGRNLTFEDGQTVTLPQYDEREDFDGIGKDGVPYILVGAHNRVKCFFSDPGDYYVSNLKRDKEYRIGENSWCIEEIKEESDGTMCVIQSYYQSTNNGEEVKKVKEVESFEEWLLIGRKLPIKR